MEWSKLHFGRDCNVLFKIYAKEEFFFLGGKSCQFLEKYLPLTQIFTALLESIWDRDGGRWMTGGQIVLNKY